jgi:hypothetical protein
LILRHYAFDAAIPAIADDDYAIIDAIFAIR